jgi:ADP-ribose pyrophosphatase YjhB (NUDIX family)
MQRPLEPQGVHKRDGAVMVSPGAWTVARADWHGRRARSTVPRLAIVPRAPLLQVEYEEIFAKVPRLTVEVVIVSSDGVLLARRQAGPCQGLWHIPGGTVRFGEPLNTAVHRVAEQELAIEVIVDSLLGYIEYPSHLERGVDWPVGIAFSVHLTPSSAGHFRSTPDAVAWFAQLPGEMHDEQKLFLREHGLAA